MTQRKRILLVGEAVTLAHVARPYVLSIQLDPQRYDVHFACARRVLPLLEEQPWTYHDLATLPSEAFVRSLAQGRPFYDERLLSSYVENDLRLLDKVRPDLVVGDFRLSLGISARLRGVRFATISNWWWTPGARTAFPRPEHPILNRLGPFADPLFHRMRPLVFSQYTRPINRVRKRYGLAPVPSLQHAYQTADDLLLADPAELTPPTFELPQHAQRLGAVVWSPACLPPPWWDSLPDRPCVYVCLGSSGAVGAVDHIVRGLSRLPVNVLLATAGRREAPTGPNLYASRYLDGTAACHRASVVINNGGALGNHQALAAGTPVLGILSNMDQFMSMDDIVRRGAGMYVRSSAVTSTTVRDKVRQLLEHSSYRETAESLGDAIRKVDCGDTFRRFISNVFEEGNSCEHGSSPVAPAS